jgi:uncharacterized protein (TIGR02301 family)
VISYRLARARHCDPPKTGARCYFLAAILGLLLATPVYHPDARAASPPQPPVAPALPVAPPQPYDVQLMRLSEILGALSYLTSICEPAQKDPFRIQMQALLDAEAPGPPRRDEYAGAYNRGYRGLVATYSRCTENARALIARFREEGVAITRQIRNLYGG